MTLMKPWNGASILKWYNSSPLSHERICVRTLLCVRVCPPARCGCVTLVARNEKRRRGGGGEKVRDQSPTGRPLCIATSRAGPTGCSESRCVYVRYQTTDILRVQSTIYWRVLVWGENRERKEKGWPRTAFHLVETSGEAVGSRPYSPVAAHNSIRLTTLHSHSEEIQTSPIQGKAHKFIVDLWPQLKSFRLDWATKYIYVQYKQQSPANYIVDDVIHLSPLSPCCLLSILVPTYYLYMSLSGSIIYQFKPLLRLSTVTVDVAHEVRSR